MADLFTFAWPEGRRAAVSLTYDDALTQHHAKVSPLLVRQGIRGTFYPTIHSRFLDETDAWREVARAGHELGNHTLFHPCYGATQAEIPWLDRGYNLRDYSPQRWEDEIRVANWALRQVDGRTARTFGNTCGHRYIGEGEARICLDSLVLKHFVAARGTVGKAIEPRAADLTNLGVVRADQRTFRELRDELQHVRETGAWIIYCIHGIGSLEHKLHIDETEHEHLVAWIGAQPDVWAVSVVEAAQWIATYQTRAA